jgi:hypothetical protein
MINYDYINKLLLENQKLKYENSFLLIENQKLKNQKINLNQINNVVSIVYRPCEISWNDNKINEIISSIHSIDDIINKLDNNLIYLRHNTILLKLYNLIPSLKKLKNMVGLLALKNNIFKKIIYYIQNNFDNEYLHTVISGDPGVGKTEFALIYAEICLKLNILKNNNFIQIKRNDLIGEHLGSTSIKTKNILESALGGVLFLDEAYSLGSSDKRDSFSKEAIDMINIYLSEKKNEFMFIIAGYEDDIEDCFFAYNKGLKRRFNTFFNIPPYTSMELKDMFINKINLSNYNLIIDSNKLDYIFIENKNNFEFYGGSIELLFNEIKHVVALRNFNNNNNNKNIILNDITNALINLYSNKRDRFDSRLSMYS